MLRTTLSTVVALALFLPPAVAAADSIKIGVIDSPELLSRSRAGKRVLAKNDKDTKAEQAKIEKMGRELKKLEKRVVRKEATSQELQTKRARLKQAIESAQRRITATRTKLIRKLEAQAMPIIQRVAKEGGYDLILEKSAVIFASPRIDLTEQIIKRMR